MNYVDFLQGWWAGWILNRDSPVAIDLRVGSPNVAKQACTLGAESSTKLGAFTIWDTGELESEVMDMDTQERTLVDSVTVNDAEDLSHFLARFVHACEEFGVSDDSDD